MANVLFLCTGNSARSILAEALLNHVGSSRFRAWSAGSHPKGAVHPMAIATLEAHGIPTAGLHSKSWDAFAGKEAPQIDLVVTVCDNAAAETCPVWPGHPVTAHWGIPDPAAVDGVDEQRRAFENTFDVLHRRVSRLASLPIGSMSHEALVEEVRSIAVRD
jgi:arsenate reductase